MPEVKVIHNRWLDRFVNSVLCKTGTEYEEPDVPQSWKLTESSGWKDLSKLTVSSGVIVTRTPNKIHVKYIKPINKITTYLTIVKP